MCTENECVWYMCVNGCVSGVGVISGNVIVKRVPPPLPVRPGGVTLEQIFFSLFSSKGRYIRDIYFCCIELGGIFII